MSSRLSALIGKAMQALGLGERMRESEVLQAWKEIVGPFYRGAFAAQQSA